MAGWEEELAVLLRELGVQQEESSTRPRPARRPMHSDVKRNQPSADALLWNERDDQNEVDIEINDLSTMRREVDAIVRQVIQLMQRGDLDSALKEDIMVVLRALRRRAAVTQQAATSEEAYLESASAMLHFCRMVLLLSEFSENNS